METGYGYESYDWDEIWSFAPIAREDSDVLYAYKSDMAEPNFAGLVKTSNGNVYAFEGWHDYTGWDCRADCEWFGPFETKEDAIKLLSEENRRGLGFVPYPEYKNLWTDQRGE